MLSKDFQKTGLLEYIAAKIGCMYLSDLRQPCFFNEVKRIMPEIEPNKYSVYEWNDAVYYLTRENKEFKTQEDAWNYIKII